MKKKLLLSLTCILLLAGCGNVKLKDGENALVTFEKGDGISSDDLYEELKETYGASTLIDLIDTYLLKDLYKTDSDENNYVKQQIKSAKEEAAQYEAYGIDFDTYLSYYYGAANEKAYKKSLSLDYKRNKWVQDYAVESVTDTQVNEYYETEVFGDIEASHILITVDVKEDASDEEKDAAKSSAKEKANEIIEKLKNGEDFAELAKEYSEDEATKENGGSLGKVNTDDVADEIINALLKLENGTYTTEPIETTYGYHIVFRTSQDEKPELDEELTNTIKEKVGSEIALEDGFDTTALQALREKYDMKIKDDSLNKKVENLTK